MEIEYENIVDKSKIIDIRSYLDYSEYNIKESKNIPKIILMANHSDYLNKEDEFYLLCDKGTVSLPCAKILNALGYKCFSIKGGIESILKIK